MKRLLIFVMCALPLFAQRDFLTPNEVDKVREVQEPNERLKLYVLFARQRLDQMQSVIVKNRPGRSLDIRQLLEQYVKIVDAMDVVADDAFGRKADLTIGITAVTAAEKKFLEQLQKFADSNPTDSAPYDFQLKEAIAATSDSLELTQSDQAVRAEEVVTKTESKRKTVEAIGEAEKTIGKAKPNTAVVDDKDGEPAKPARKPPTIYRPGETAAPAAIPSR